ncbi:tRNA (N6-isopentenyl adenosine(37)-C2)-methylthiotransferase MiaB [Patescibacteria group bacterium]|nr:tRNA (N6-isopentenyl adenosine(37)-C2)-methylthiotransferase MiaB [Patescibacteria group bacterium]MBP9710055.1 tRNA (N6-isopentenyl adenosine(37)-C2)-methylthiotransferase MiaB [Patescibacteria group bacterium]
MSSPTFYITTFGCQMNKNDSERMAGLLSSLGFVTTEDEATADVVLINTCSVRQSAEDRIYGAQEKYLEYKKTKPNMIVAVTGCMPGRDKARVFKKRLPATDLYFPTPDMVHLPRWISELRPELVNSASLEEDYFKIHPHRVPSVQAFVTIQTGCNKFCTYCVVPYARGLERNRPVKDILEECRELVAHGVLEITLLGQTVNSFKATDPESFSQENPYKDHFAALLWEINQLEGLQRLHWTAAHPLSMTDEVIHALTLPKQVNYLHLPVQSGSDEVLRRMNRKYTREQYLEVIRKIKTARPGVALGSDIIVGFSGETPEQFEETLTLYREVDFDISYNAQYSIRSGTLGIKLYADDVSKEEKRDRWDRIQEVMEEVAMRKNQAFIGKTVSVLIDKVAHGFASGNTFEMKLARFPSTDEVLIGKIIEMEVKSVKTWVLEGEKRV